MAPTPVNLKELQPFKAVRDNWSTIKPYHDNYITTISFATVLTAFLGTVSLIIKHGLTMPRLHPTMDADELKPSPHLDHPNEYISEQDLGEAKAFEFEQAYRWEMAIQEAERWAQQQEKSKQTTQAAEEGFKETAEAGVENAMDILDDELGAFNDEEVREDEENSQN
jgi:hypothetical protein